ALLKNKQPLIKAYKKNHQELWSLAVDGQGDMLRAGNRLYAAGAKTLSAITLPVKKDQKPKIAWQIPIKGQVLRLVAADDKLFAVTLEGEIKAFGTSSDDSTPQSIVQKNSDTLISNPNSIKKAKSLLETTQSKKGYMICYGADNQPLFDAFLQHSPLRLIVIENDLSKVQDLRTKYDALNLYGSRITVHQGTPDSFQAPQHIARITLISDTFARTLSSKQLKQIYRSVRPYGGVISIPAENQTQKNHFKSIVDESKLPKAKLNLVSSGILIQRKGALPDSADWTHQYGDIANTVKSNDKRVKLPLGVLWFGGNTHDDILPRHGHGPPEQVVGGRTFLEGMNSLSARDVYTGEVLWHREFEDLGTFGIYFNTTYKDTPLSTQYNQKHIPGANSRGTNYIATAEKVYLAIGSECHVLNAADGSTQQIIKLPNPENAWAFIAVYDEILLAGNGFAHYGKRLDEKPGKDGPSATDLSASQGLIAYDRHSGEKIWQVDAINSFLHNGIVAGKNRIYCLDKLPASAEKKLSRRGLADPKKYRILCIDALTGKELWSTNQNIFGSWLGYSKSHDLLLQAGARAKDRLSDEIGQGMLAFQGDTGKVLWHNKDRKYTGPCVLHNDLIITSANSYEVSGGAFNIVDGTPYSIINPITKQKEPLKFSRTYGCNYVIASENLLTFRSGAAGFYDLESQSGTGNFGGFKSSCTSNLVVANGVLNAPDYTRTCSCSYQNQTSLALIHMPEIEVWTNSQLGTGPASASLVKQAGVNFGAPGDRRSENGTLWLDYPSVGGPSPDLKVTLSNHDFGRFRHHSLKIKVPIPKHGLNWVAASGIENPQKITIEINQQTKAKAPEGIPIAGVDDDAEEGSRGEVKLHSSDLELGLDGKDPSIVGLRFTNIPLTSADDLEAAYIQFTVDELGNSTSKLKIQAENSVNSQPFVETKSNISARRRTKAYAEWSPAAWSKLNANGSRQATTDLTPLLKEILANKEWKAGNSISFLFTGTGTRIAKSYKGASSGSARLVLKTKSQSLLAKETRKQSATEKSASRYTIKLTFTEPDDKVQSGERQFDIGLQGKRVIQNLDIVQETGQSMRCLVKEFPGIPVNDQIEIEFNAADDSKYPPVISGIEVISEI
ncbi:malectin domain-containing carbohydrate-binding protein, partial [uncultured Gimesia sp.]|uniref:malectin domain-containing carbohydrate-binding protein n=1 Tax=uncultured Gimesia sp. TaxID=1678688 RepID=UPI00261AB822